MTDEDTAADLDPDQLGLMVLRVWGYKQGEVVSMMIHLGLRLGLFRTLDGAGPTTAVELAERTGCDERWLREWLEGMAAAELVVRDPDGPTGTTFELTPEAAAVLADEQGSLLYAGGAFVAPPPAPEVVDGMVETFRTGVGLSYDQRGPNAAHQIEGMLGPWTELALIPTILPRIDGVVDALDAGATVADVGCGSALGLVALGRAFPASTFHGYDSSRHAVERGRANLAEAGVTNVELHHVDGSALPDEPTYDLVLTFDVLHDMTRPDEVAAAIRSAVRPDGTWLIKDIRCADTFEENRANPMLAMFYGFSIGGCLASSTSEPGGAALGTLGLPPSAMERLCREAGFGSFEQLDVGEPANLYYVARP